MTGKRDTAEKTGATPGADADTDDAMDPFTDDDVTAILDDAWEDVTE